MIFKDIAEYEDTDSELAKYTISKLHSEIDYLRERINKAIELIKKYLNTCILDEEWSSIDKPLLEILKGEDND